MRALACGRHIAHKMREHSLTGRRALVNTTHDLHWHRSCSPHSPGKPLAAAADYACGVGQCTLMRSAHCQTHEPFRSLLTNFSRGTTSLTHHIASQNNCKNNYTTYAESPIGSYYQSVPQRQQHGATFTERKKSLPQVRALHVLVIIPSDTPSEPASRRKGYWPKSLAIILNSYRNY